MVSSKFEHSSNSGQNYRVIVAIIIVGFLFRVIVPILAFSVTKDLKIFHSYDTAKYIGAGVGLVTTGQFVTNGIPETIRTPGYPLLMVPGIWLGAVELLTVALQILLGCVTIYLIYRTGLSLFRASGPALCAAVLYAVEPLSVVYTSLLMSETLFATTLIFFLYYFLDYLKNNDWRSLIISAIFSAICVYVRPISYFFGVLVIMFLIIRAIVRRSWNRKEVFQIVSFLLIGYGLLAPWQIRNSHYTGSLSFSGVSSDDLYFFAASTVLANVNKVPYEEQREQMAYSSAELYLKPHPDGREWTAVDVRRWRSSEAFNIITSYPLNYFKMVTLGVAWTFVGPGVGSWLELFKINQDSTGKGKFATEDDKLYYLRVSRLSYWGSIFLGLALGSYWVLALIGVCKIYTQAMWPLIFLIMTAVYFVLVPAMLAIGYSRFRHPIIPILCILGGYGLFTILDKWKHRSEFL